MRPARLGAVLLGALVALAGCGEGVFESEEARTVYVRLTNFDLRPERLEIEEPGLAFFRVRNDGRSVHALEVSGPGVAGETEPIRPGAGATLRVNLAEPGEYELRCPFDDHEERGMRGVITVGE